MNKIRLDSYSKKIIAERLYANECGSQRKYLLHWNEGEEFMSLGIGHFIWYPVGAKKIFEEMFPKFLDFMRKTNKTPLIIPELLTTHAPYKNIDELKNDENLEKYNKIVSFLESTIEYQAQFAFIRAENVLQKITNVLPCNKQKVVANNFNNLAKSGAIGIYTIVDYLNFKGDGLNPAERYKTQGWGLLQVLEYMENFKRENSVNDCFAFAAKELLKQRIANSDPTRGEKRWLPGWLNRINSYKKD